MKDFIRNDLSFSLCGLNCLLCPMRIGDYCPGCGGGKGNQPCAIAKCSLKHDKVQYCFLCSHFPCSKYDSTDKYDSFITHRNQLSDIEKARNSNIGIKAYCAEQERKSEILHTLLTQYNDGRRKSFYCIAVNLLPLIDIENVMKQISVDASSHNLTVKEKAEFLTYLFNKNAASYGIELKLRKKPAGK